VNNILKKVNKQVTECCKVVPLIQVHSSKSWSLWDFCPNCLNCYDLINDHKKSNLKDLIPGNSNDLKTSTRKGAK